MSGVGSSTMSGTPSRFLILPSAATLGRKSATAAAITITSALARASTSRCICSAVSTRDDGDAGGRRELDGAHEHDRRATRRGLGGDRVALLAGAAVGDDAHGVDRLPGAAGGHDDLRAGEVAPPGEDPLGGGHDVDRVGEPAGADVTAGEAPDGGFDDVHAAPAQGGDVLGDGRVLPHLGVHRRADQHRRPGGEQRVGEQVGGQPGGVGADQLGRGRGDDDQVGVLPEAGVRDRRRAGPQLASAPAHWPVR